MIVRIGTELEPGKARQGIFEERRLGGYQSRASEQWVSAEQFFRAVGDDSIGKTHKFADAQEMHKARMITSGCGRHAAGLAIDGPGGVPSLNPNRRVLASRLVASTG